MGVNSWRDHAACKGLTEDKGYDWFPARGRYVTTRQGSQVSGETKTLLDICNECPVKLACREYAIVNNEPGIWGGTSSRQRRAIKRARAKGYEVI